LSDGRPGAHDRPRRARPVRPAARPPRRPSAAHRRFLEGDRERALREWQRYEGTAQRDLFRELRERFLGRHAVDGGWSLDVGAGPGRFTGFLGGPGARRVAVDLSLEMLRTGRELSGRAPAPAGRPPDRVWADALKPPFLPAGFRTVALLGNTLGFETRSGPELLGATERLVAPGGRLLLEVAPGSGERSRYLTRLPPGAVRRLLAAPVAAVAPRVEREGYVPEPGDDRLGSFRRWSVEEVVARWERQGWRLLEATAVAPALGPAAERLAEVARSPPAWSRLLELEEALGRSPRRWPAAAAALLAAERPPSPTKTIDPSQPSIAP
jgi:SAM-dependent methyltransferase